MKIAVKKFGEILTSRPAEQDAGKTMKAYFRPEDGEKIELDFEGILAVGPAWLDEVLSILIVEFGKDRVV
jgi:hypothetical protein